MSSSATPIPYEQQFDVHATRTCGAACLAMVYRSLGLEVPQQIIWPLIAKKNIYGSIASTTHLMAADALSRGFATVAMQARHPLQALRVCRDSGIRAILNHRLKPDSPAGHYTVFVDIDDTQVILHDPYFGPRRRITHDVFLDLWQPRLPNSEIVGNFLIGIAPAPSAPESSSEKRPPSKPCETCKTPLASPVQCPRCKNPVALEPLPLVGCLNNACMSRLWNYICCPSCDLTWNFTLEPPRVSAAAAAFSSPVSANAPGDSATPPATPAGSTDAGNQSLDLAKVFGELDKFCNHILTIPGAVNHPDIKAQLAFIASSKEQLTLAMAEAAANRKLRDAQLAAFTKAAADRQAAHDKKVEELKKPLAPLDGDTLARALLKNLGFLS